MFRLILHTQAKKNKIKFQEIFFFNCDRFEQSQKKSHQLNQLLNAMKMFSDVTVTESTDSNESTNSTNTENYFKYPIDPILDVPWIGEFQ